MKFQMYHENYNVTDLHKSLAFYEKALGLKEKRRVNGEDMGCICFENPAMGIYFIADPDGYWLEIVPRKK